MKLNIIQILFSENTVCFDIDFIEAIKLIGVIYQIKRYKYHITVKAKLEN